MVGVPFVVVVRTLAILIMFDGVYVLLSNETISIRLASVVPLLIITTSIIDSGRVKKMAHFVSHDTLRVTLSSIPTLEVRFLTLALPGRLEIEMNDDNSSTGACLVPSSDLA